MAFSGPLPLHISLPYDKNCSDIDKFCQYSSGCILKRNILKFITHILCGKIRYYHVEKNLNKKGQKGMDFALV
jgi:hypothetical protein